MWLMFDGERHRLDATVTTESLFTDPAKPVKYYGVDLIACGSEISADSCLVSAEGFPDIYLVISTLDHGVRKQRIQTWQSFCDFGFDKDKIKIVPPVLLEALSAGPDITSAHDRASL